MRANVAMVWCCWWREDSARLVKLNVILGRYETNFPSPDCHYIGAMRLQDGSTVQQRKPTPEVCGLSFLICLKRSHAWKVCRSCKVAKPFAAGQKYAVSISIPRDRLLNIDEKRDHMWRFRCTLNILGWFKLPCRPARSAAPQSRGVASGHQAANICKKGVSTEKQQKRKGKSHGFGVLKLKISKTEQKKPPQKVDFFVLYTFFPLSDLSQPNVLPMRRKRVPWCLV